MHTPLSLILGAITLSTLSTPITARVHIDIDIDSNSQQAIRPAQPLPSAHTTASWYWTDCGSPEDAITITSLITKPDVPVPGENYTIVLDGTANSKIVAGAYTDVTLKIGLVKLMRWTGDLCAMDGMACPIEEGAVHVELQRSLPKEIPQAKYSVGVQAYTVADDPVLCFDAKVDYFKGPFDGPDVKKGVFEL